MGRHGGHDTRFCSYYGMTPVDGFFLDSSQCTGGLKRRLLAVNLWLIQSLKIKTTLLLAALILADLRTLNS